MKTITDIGTYIDHDLDFMEKKDRYVYSIIGMILGRIYYQTKWWSVGRNKISTDIFQHRIRKASRRMKMSEFISDLCGYLNLQAYHQDPALVMEAEKYADEILGKIRNESQLVVMISKAYSDHLKAIRKEEKKKNETKKN